MAEAGAGYVQDERYIAIEHMDVRRDCVSFARPIIGCCANRTQAAPAHPSAIAPASPKAPTFGALPPASLQSCARGVPFILNISVPTA